MNDLFIYLLKVSAGLSIIFLPYYFLFRNDPNLIIKRFYLISGVLAAWIFPFITFRKLPLVVDLTPTVFIDLDTPAVPTALLENTGSSGGLTINWLQVLVLVYLAGLTFMFLKNLFIIFKWNLTWRRTKNEEGVAFIKNDQVFTLFTRIFVPGSLRDEKDLDNVLLHEKAHIRQLHFIDLMLMEFTLLLTWFNPFSWLISRMIKENHEHLADRQVLSAGVNPARYRAQLMNHTLGVNVFRLGNQFNHSLTLKRFKMMKKPKRSPWGILKIALLIPAILVTLGLTTGMTPQQKTVKGKVVFADTGAPATGASIVIRNGTTGCVVDIEGTFMLNVDGDPELVISFVGYKSLIVKASDIGKMPLKLEVETYNMDLESVPLEVKKEASGAISLRLKDGSEAQPVFVVDGKEVKGVDHL
ncbi:MAG: carboxypeptidase-like regulatory domain-containing protein, partial [Bacteroidales bacterium]|nr:carboxypeptidase-like regulatory domain-containing protein [Bacteroidales bacterium]